MCQSNYHRRYRQDGSCQIICTQCFSTLGTAFNSVQAHAMETGHICHDRIARPGNNRSPSNHLPSIPRSKDNLLARARHFVAFAIRQRDYLPATIAASFLLFYALPTALELLAAPYLNIWIGSIIPGDMAACFCIAILFRRPRTALVLYAVLTAFEAYLHVAYLLPVNVIAWITDLFPSLAVAALIVRASADAGARDSVLS